MVSRFEAGHAAGVGGHVDHLFGRGDGEGRVLGDGLCQGESLGHHLGRRNDMVHETDLSGAFGADRISGHQNFEQHLLRDHVGQRHGPGHPPAHLGLGDREARGLRGHHQVAHLHQGPAPGVGRAVHGGDHGFADANVHIHGGQEVAREHADALA